MFCDPKAPRAKYPHLSTRVKAGETRHLIPIIANIWQDIMKRDSVRDNTVADLLNANAELYDVIRDEPHHMGEAAAQRVQELIAIMLQSYQSLSSAAFFATPRQLLWNERPKHHYLAHVGDTASRCNPRYAWTYSDEDFMGRLKKMEKCATRAQRVKRWCSNSSANGASAFRCELCTVQCTVNGPVFRR